MTIGKRVTDLTLFTTVSLLFCGSVFSQGITFFDDKNRPMEALATKTRPDTPRMVWSNQADNLLYSSWDCQKELNRKLGFLQSVALADERETDGKKVYLLCETFPNSKNIKSFLGWIDGAKLLTTNSALTIETKTGTSSKVKMGAIHKKGMAIVRKESIKKFPPTGIPNIDGLNKDPNNLKAIVFQAPRVQVATDLPVFSQELPIYSFYFVYAESTEFVLVGNAAKFDATKPVADVVKGWIPKVNHAPWNNRVGYEWAATTFPTKRKEVGYVFDTAREARDFYYDRSSYDSKPPNGSVFQEVVVKDQSVPLPHSAMRMPWLDNQLTPFDGLEIASVGWIGGDESKRAKAKERATQMAKEARQLELLFLIDHTESMQPHFAQVATAVEQIIADLKAKYKSEDGSIYSRSLSISISFYGDEEFPEDTPTVIRKFQKISSNSLGGTKTKSQLDSLRFSENLTPEDMIQELKQHPAKGGGSIEEDLLIGISKAIKAFSQDNSKKLLFVIGDMGDHSPEIANNKEISSIARQLTEAASPIQFFPLQVKTKQSETKEGSTIAQRFNDQLVMIQTKANRLLKERKASGDDLLPEKVTLLSESAKLAEEIRGRYQKLQQEVDRYQIGLIGDHSKLTTLEIDALKNNQVDVKQLDTPLFREGFVAHKPRELGLTKKPVFQGGSDVVQVERRILFFRQDLERLKRFLVDFVSKLESNENDQAVGPILKQVIQSVYGEGDFSDVTPTEALELALGMKLDNSVLGRIAQYGEVKLKDIAQLSASQQQISSILDKTPREYSVVQDKAGKWNVVPSNIVGSDRGFTQPGDPLGTEWFWLKESELP